ncbi:MAG: hypothetical protein AB8B83_00670 [Bdellovibrionales bacterium]
MPRHTFSSSRSATDDSGLILSASPEKAMNEMMGAIDALRDVYVAENQALEKSDTQGFMSLQNEKFRTAMLYQQGIEQILSRKDEMRRVDPTLKRKLARMQDDFSKLAATNKDAIKRMQRTMDRLNNSIRTAAKDAVNKQQATSYGEHGRLHTQDKRVVSTGISETA